jgi:hypothetical protein
MLFIRCGAPPEFGATNPGTPAGALEPVFGIYRSDPYAPIAHAAGLMVLTIRGTRIAELSNFLDSNALGASTPAPR